MVSVASRQSRDDIRMVPGMPGFWLMAQNGGVDH